MDLNSLAIISLLLATSPQNGKDSSQNAHQKTYYRQNVMQAVVGLRKKLDESPREIQGAFQTFISDQIENQNIHPNDLKDKENDFIKVQSLDASILTVNQSYNNHRYLRAVSFKHDSVNGRGYIDKTEYRIHLVKHDETGKTENVTVYDPERRNKKNITLFGNDISLASNGTWVTGAAWSGQKSYHSGKVYIYQGLRAEPSQTIQSPAGNHCEFGRKVSISQDGKKLYATGAVKKDHQMIEGVYVYPRNDDHFLRNPVRIIESPNPIPVQEYSNSAIGSRYHNFGYDLASSQDGSILVIGAPLDLNNPIHKAVKTFQEKENPYQGTGAAYIYIKGKLSKLIPSHQEEGQHFGISVSISTDGSYIAIGSPGLNNHQGGIYVFHMENGRYIQKQIITNPDDHAGDRFGRDVEIISYENGELKISATYGKKEGIKTYKITDETSGNKQFCHVINNF